MVEERTVYTLSNGSSLEPTWSIMNREGGTSHRNSGPSQSTRRHRIEEADEEDDEGERDFQAAAAVNYDGLSHRAPSERDQQRLGRQSLAAAKPGPSHPARPTGILQVPGSQLYQHSRQGSQVSLSLPPARSNAHALKGRSSRRTSAAGHFQLPSHATSRHSRYQPESVTVTDEGGDVPTVLFGHQNEPAGDRSRSKARARQMATHPPVSGGLQPGGHSHRRSITIQDTPTMRLAKLRRAVVGVSMYGATDVPSSESEGEGRKERSRSRELPSVPAPRPDTEGAKSVGSRSKGKSREQPSELDDVDEMMSTTNKQYSQGPRRLRTQRSIMNSWVPTEWMHSEAGGDDATTSVMDNKSTTEWGRSVRSAAPSRRPGSGVYGYYGHGAEKSFAWSGGSRLEAVEQSPSEDELEYEKDEQVLEEEEEEEEEPEEPERDEPDLDDDEIGEIPDELDDIVQRAPPPAYSTNAGSRETVLAAAANLERKRHGYGSPKRPVSKRSASSQSSATPRMTFPSVAARRALFDGQIMGRPLPVLAKRQAPRKPESEPAPESSPEPEPEPEPELEPDWEPEPEPVRAPSPKAAPRVAPKIAPKPPPKPAPRPIHKPEPVPEPEPEPERRREPSLAEAPAPRPTPAPRPVARPTPMPRPVKTPTPVESQTPVALPARRPAASPVPARKPVASPASVARSPAPAPELISQPTSATVATPRPESVPAPRPVSARRSAQVSAPTSRPASLLKSVTALRPAPAARPRSIIKPRPEPEPEPEPARRRSIKKARPEPEQEQEPEPARRRSTTKPRPAPELEPEPARRRSIKKPRPEAEVEQEPEPELTRRTSIRKPKPEPEPEQKLERVLGVQSGSSEFATSDSNPNPPAPPQRSSESEAGSVPRKVSAEIQRRSISPNQTSDAVPPTPPPKSDRDYALTRKGSGSRVNQLRGVRWQPPIPNTDSSVAGSDPRVAEAEHQAPRSTSCEDGASFSEIGHGVYTKLVSWRSGPLEVQAPLYGGQAERGNVLAAEDRIFWYEDVLEKKQFESFDREVRGSPFEIELGKFAFSQTFQDYGGRGALCIPANARDINGGDRGASLETFWMSFEEVRITRHPRMIRCLSQYDPDAEFVLFLYLLHQDDARVVEMCPVVFSVAILPAQWRKRWKAGHPVEHAMPLKQEYLAALKPYAH